MKIRSLSKKRLILSLIKDHLVSHRLIQGLEKLGLNALKFDLYISQTIFTLMGFNGSVEDEQLFEEFLELSDKVLTIEFSEDDPEPLNNLTKRLYKKLKAESQLRKTERSIGRLN